MAKAQAKSTEGMRILGSEGAKPELPLEIVMGEARGSLFNDRVLVPLSPADLTDLKAIFTELAQSGGRLPELRRYLGFVDRFGDAYDEWRFVRTEKDAVNEG